MRIVNFTDEKGYLRATMIKDDDPDKMAKFGVPVEIPDLNELDWDGLKRDLHNALTREGLYTLKDVMKTGNGFAPAMTIVKRFLAELYSAKVMEEL